MDIREYSEELSERLSKMNLRELREYAEEHRIQLNSNDVAVVESTINRVMTYRMKKHDYGEKLREKLKGMNLKELREFADEHDIQLYSRNESIVTNTIVCAMQDKVVGNNPDIYTDNSNKHTEYAEVTCSIKVPTSYKEEKVKSIFDNFTKEHGFDLTGYKYEHVVVGEVPEKQLDAVKAFISAGLTMQGGSDE